MNFREMLAYQWARYERLSDREQMLTICTGLVFLVVFFVFFVWDPIHDARDEAQQRYKQELELQAQISAFKQAGPQTGSTTVTSQDQSLLAIVNKTTADQRISLKRVEPKNDQSLRVWVDNVQFNRLIVWLELLQINHGVSVDTLSMDQTQTPGSVNTALVLERSF